MSGEQLAVQIGVVAAMVGAGIGTIARWVGRFLDRLLDRTIAAADAQHAQVRADNAALRQAIDGVQDQVAELRLELYVLHAHLGIGRKPPPGAPPGPPPPSSPPAPSG